MTKKWNQHCFSKCNYSYWKIMLIIINIHCQNYTPSQRDNKLFVVIINYHYSRVWKWWENEKKGNAMRLPYNKWEFFSNWKKREKNSVLKMLVSFFFFHFLAQFGTVVSLTPAWSHQLQVWFSKTLSPNLKSIPRKGVKKNARKKCKEKTIK